MSKTLIDVSALLDRKYDHGFLAAMLLVLHAAVIAGLPSLLARALMTTHLGLFFLWQPIWHRERKLDWPPLLLIIAFSATFVGRLNAWLMFAWLVLLAGIVAGRTRTSSAERYALMLALIFLMSELLIVVVPQVFAVATIEYDVVSVVKRILLVIPFLILLLRPAQRAARQTYPIEFFGGIIVALITAQLAVSSVLLSTVRQLPYPAALLVALLAVAALLVFISWLIAPSTGTGLGALWEKSVLNIGTPFESWMTRLAELADQINSPDDFLQAAFNELARTPWIRGVRWRTRELNGQVGVTTSRNTEISTDPLQVTLFIDRPLGPTLLLHCRLLVETVNHFYAAKSRAQEQLHQAHMRAIFETGARLTHDIKNLLQSLKLLTTATSEPGSEAQRMQLLQRQLPLITSRLQIALDKLTQPVETTDEFIELHSWWEQFKGRHAASDLECIASFDNDDAASAAECLDSVVENLVDNARHKRTDTSLKITVEIKTRRGNFLIAVTDTGQPLPEDLVGNLFKRALPSQQGLGVGLYQAFNLAQKAQLSLRLVTNRPGEVRFEFGNLVELAT